MPQGRLLNHCITRPDNTGPARVTDGFIYRYVFPDGELEGPGYLMSLMHDSGFEVRHAENLREHYAKTLAAWCANLDDHWDEAVAEVGEGTARVWRLYMAGSRLGFERNQIQLHQMLGVKLGQDGAAGMPLRPEWEPPQFCAGLPGSAIVASRSGLSSVWSSAAVGPLGWRYVLGALARRSRSARSRRRPRSARSR